MQVEKGRIASARQLSLPVDFLSGALHHVLLDNPCLIIHGCLLCSPMELYEDNH